YESNEASVITNVSSDHLDLQGIHTLPELAEVKSTVARVTKPDGWAVLNADDPLVAAIAPRVRARVAMFSVGAGHGGAAPVPPAAAVRSCATAGWSRSTAATGRRAGARAASPPTPTLSSTGSSRSSASPSRSAGSRSTTSRTRWLQQGRRAASA